ncbi:hypothetical protein O7623_02300 [Solwaraspora sp. WMMD791]|uniref:hypothetical protein n=1 Tax=Solwaraspora sp. WMMD791 TaxID=3016086 RepID=UPI00249B9889|nr:hypothetical protein [Solwaraspora sp. WMMD791]WFE28058.1 hypothetical protein O7623_02300 [Solwaraspora sp. WMMD791]
MTVTPRPDSSEPLWSVGGVTAVVTAVLAVVTAFGLPLTDAQQAAILGLVAVVAPLVVALIGRTRVYAPATVERLVRDAAAGTDR